MCNLEIQGNQVKNRRPGMRSLTDSLSGRNSLSSCCHHAIMVFRPPNSKIAPPTTKNPSSSLSDFSLSHWVSLSPLFSQASLHVAEEREREEASEMGKKGCWYVREEEEKRGERGSGEMRN